MHMRAHGHLVQHRRTGCQSGSRLIPILNRLYGTLHLLCPWHHVSLKHYPRPKAPLTHENVHLAGVLAGEQGCLGLQGEVGGGGVLTI